VNYAHYNLFAEQSYCQYRSANKCDLYAIPLF